MNRELIVVLLEKGYSLEWNETDKKTSNYKNKAEEKIYKDYKEDKIGCLFNLGFLEKHFVMSESLYFIYTIAKKYVNKLIKTPEIEILRESVKISINEEESKEILSNAPFIYSQEYLSVQWLEELFININKYFCENIKLYKGSVSDFFITINPNIHHAGKVYFHLVENKKDNAPFAFLATYSEYITKEGKVKHMPLKNALLKYGEDSKKLINLLSCVSKAARMSTFVKQILESGEIFHPLGLSASEAYTFLKEVEIYEESGILCRIPNWWKKRKYKSKVSISLDKDISSGVNKENIISFDLSVSIGGEELSVEEFKKLKNETEGLLLIKGKWVEVDHNSLSKTLEIYEKAQKLKENGNMSIIEAMNFSINADNELGDSETESYVELSHGDWLNTVLNKLVNPEYIDEIEKSSSFEAKLRKYQQDGLNWLYFMKKMGLGACLADDMGLGKTVQVLALLDYVRSKVNEKSLLIIPATLLGNWEIEIKKFAPKLPYYILHPSANDDINIFNSCEFEKNELFITTYGMAKRLSWLTENRWSNLILDEGQAIKNPNTKQTKVIKKLEADFKIILTGTPIENRLMDLWSLFDFLNKGLLGTMNEFKKYTKRVRNSIEGYSKLRKIVNPFILRRTKTDKKIIPDLPDKVEMKVYSTLTKKQAMLYQTQVNEIKKALVDKENGIERKGLILSSITKFKQICNHPDHFLGTDSYIEKESGKFIRLRELCETILEKRERVLVFTQFKGIIEYLNIFLYDVFKHEGLAIHGGTPVSKRKEIVGKFQSEEYFPFMILSLKAGGVGLNLTKANHVIHFDRWWNPAVENQATDRAFRIGQHKNVLVHKFITKGTIEEKIDIIIEEKKELSGNIISDNANSVITEMSNDELLEMFKLSI